MDISAFDRWDRLHPARDAMFIATDTAWAPGSMAHSEDKKRCASTSSPTAGAHPLRGAADRAGEAAQAQDRQSQTIGAPASASCQPSSSQEVSPGSPFSLPAQGTTRHRQYHPMACCCSRFPALPPMLQRRYSGPAASRRVPMLRLLALLLVCTGVPGAGTLTLTPVAGAAPPLGLAFPAGWRLPRQQSALGACCIDAGGNRHVVSGLPPRRHGSGVCSDLALDGDGWLYLSYSGAAGTEAPAPPWPGPDCKRGPRRLATAVFAKSPGGRRRPLRLPPAGADG